MTAPTSEMRTIGPLEQHAIDTAPFGGLAQHYYQLWLRGSDAIDGLERALAAARDRADRAEARIANAVAFWVGPESLPESVAAGKMHAALVAESEATA